MKSVRNKCFFYFNLYFYDFTNAQTERLRVATAAPFRRGVWRGMRQKGALFEFVESLMQGFNLSQMIVAGFAHLSGHQRAKQIAYARECDSAVEQ